MFSIYGYPNLHQYLGIYNPKRKEFSVCNLIIYLRLHWDIYCHSLLMNCSTICFKQCSVSLYQLHTSTTFMHRHIHSAFFIQIKIRTSYSPIQISIFKTGKRHLGVTCSNFKTINIQNLIMYQRFENSDSPQKHARIKSSLI